MTIEKNNYNFSRLSRSGKSGFEVFAENGFFYFHINDRDGQAVLFSRAFGTMQERDNCMRTIREINRHPELYDVKEGKSGFFLSVRISNRREIARSPAYATRDEADDRLRLLLDILPAGEDNASAPPIGKNDFQPGKAGITETPRHYFDLKFYPDGRGVIQYPLTREMLCFKGLDEHAIVGFVKSRLTHPPVKNRAKAVSAPPIKGTKKKNELKISLPFSTISKEELARIRTVEVGIGTDTLEGEAIHSAFFFLKALKKGQVFHLNECAVSDKTTTRGDALAFIALPRLETGLYRLIATRENTPNPFTGEGHLFQVI